MKPLPHMVIPYMAMRGVVTSNPSLVPPYMAMWVWPGEAPPPRPPIGGIGGGVALPGWVRGVRRR